MTTSPVEQTDVLIVGAGPAGLALACELLRRGLKIRLLDKALAPASTSRALGLQSRTLELFANMGLIDPVLQRGGPIFGASFYEADQLLFRIGGEELQAVVQRPDVPYPFPWVMPQSEVEAMLTDRLHQLGGAVEPASELIDFHEQAEAILATVQTAGGARTLQARWLVGCDGAHSRVRHQLGLNFEGSAYEENFLLADVNLDWTRGRDTTHTWFHRSGLLAIIPFPGGQQWRIFADFTPPKGQPAPAVSLELFQQIFRERAGDTVTSVSAPSWMSNFVISRRLVERYRVGRVFLAGDAAHIHSPFGGQGMNTGIQDAFNLAWKLALVTRGQAPAALLDTYEAERRPVAAHVLQETDANTKVILSKSPLIKFLRQRIVPLPAFQRYILWRGSELDIQYRASVLSSTQQTLPGLVARLPFPSAPQAGDRAPQAYGVDGGTGAKLGVFEAMRGTAWHLLLFAGSGRHAERSAALTALARRAQALLGDSLQAHLILAARERPTDLVWEGSLLLDPRRELHRRYGAGGSLACLIRPDGYIGFRSQPAAEQPLLDYLSRVFVLEPVGASGEPRGLAPGGLPTRAEFTGS